MNVAAGFADGFSFFYSAISNSGSVSVYDDLDGTGNLLATLALPTTQSGPCPGFNAGFCPFVPVGVAFAGIAKSVSFAGAANQIVFDDVTFGSDIPDPQPSVVPLPASLPLLLVGLGAFGIAARRQKRT
ncbi:MAG: VPLPA-CTERM sorting domain-containing protein [Rhodobacteraceae bacterium]|nr:VPLPA-CTERM sorting domain-containing protein [Paracoccaceae bacterium]